MELTLGALLPWLYFTACLAVVSHTVWWRRALLRKRAWQLGRTDYTLGDRLLLYLERHALSRRLLDLLALALNTGRGQPEETGRRHALLAAAALLAAFALGGGALLAAGHPPASVLRILTGCAGLILLILILWTGSVQARFSRQLPDVLRILNSRYLVTGDICEALRISREDVGHRMGRLLNTLRETLLLNDVQQRDRILRELRDRYRDPHFTMLTYLVRQAAEKGGVQIIGEQFLDVAEDCLLVLEHKRNLRAQSRSYCFLILFLLVLYPLARGFNIRALGLAARLFYDSGQAFLFSTLYYLLGAVAISVLLFLERSYA